MSLRLEFMSFALEKDRNMSELCWRLSISRKADYEWLERYQEHSEERFADVWAWMSARVLPTYPIHAPIPHKSLDL